MRLNHCDSDTGANKGRHRLHRATVQGRFLMPLHQGRMVRYHEVSLPRPHMPTSTLRHNIYRHRTLVMPKLKSCRTGETIDFHVDV